MNTESIAEKDFFNTLREKWVETDNQVEIKTWKWYSYFLDWLTEEKTDIEFDWMFYHIHRQNKDKIRALFLKDIWLFVVRIFFNIPKDLIYWHLYWFEREKKKNDYIDWKSDFDDFSTEKTIDFLKEKETYNFVSDSLFRWYVWDETWLCDEKFKKECEKFKKDFEKKFFNQFINKENGK